MNPSPISSNPNMQAPLAPVVSTTQPPSLPPLSKKPMMNKRRKNLILGVVGFFLIIVGGIATYVISQRSQDLRQRASYTFSAAEHIGPSCTNSDSCNAGFVCRTADDGTKACVKVGNQILCTGNGDCDQVLSRYVGGSGVVVCREDIGNNGIRYCRRAATVGGSQNDCKGDDANCSNPWMEWCNNNTCQRRSMDGLKILFGLEKTEKGPNDVSEVTVGTPLLISVGDGRDPFTGNNLRRTQIWAEKSPGRGSASNREDWTVVADSSENPLSTNGTWIPTAPGEYWIGANTWWSNATFGSFAGDTTGTFTRTGNPYCDARPAECLNNWGGSAERQRTKIRVVSAPVSCTSMTLSATSLTTSSPITITSAGSGTPTEWIYSFYNLDNQKPNTPVGYNDPEPIKFGGQPYKIVATSATQSLTVSLFDKNDENTNQKPTRIQVNLQLKINGQISPMTADCARPFTITAAPVTLTKPTVSVNPTTPLSTTTALDASLTCSAVTGAVRYEFRVGPAEYPVTIGPTYLNIDPASSGSRNSKAVKTIIPSIDIGNYLAACRACSDAEENSCSAWSDNLTIVVGPTAPATVALLPTTGITTASENVQIQCESTPRTGATYEFQYKLAGAPNFTPIDALTDANRNKSKAFKTNAAGSMTYECRVKVGTQTSAWKTASFTVPAAAQLSNSEVSITPASLFTVTNNAYISCAPTAGATRYQFQLKRPNGNFASLEAQAAPLATRSAIFNTFDPGVYEYRCRPCTGTGTGDTGCVAWDALSANRGTKSFTSVIPYSRVTLVSPGAPTTSTTNAFLTCGAIRGATRFQFQVKRPGAPAPQRIASDSAVASRSATFATNTVGVYEYACRPCYGTGQSDANCKEWQTFRATAPVSIATQQITVGFTYPTVSISPDTLNTATTNAKITCGEVTGAVRYQFQYGMENTQTISRVNPSATGSRESAPFSTPLAGNLIYQCRPCSGTDDSTCLAWETLSDTSTATKRIAVATFTVAPQTPAPLPTPITQIVQVPSAPQIIQVPVAAQPTTQIVQVPAATQPVATQPRPTSVATAQPVTPIADSTTPEASPEPSELPKAGAVAGTSTAIGIGAVLSILGVIAFLLL